MKTDTFMQFEFYLFIFIKTSYNILSTYLRWKIHGFSIRDCDYNAEDNVNDNTHTHTHGE